MAFLTILTVEQMLHLDERIAWHDCTSSQYRRAVVQEALSFRKCEQIEHVQRLCTARLFGTE